MKFKTLYWLSHYGIFIKSQYTIISKYGKRARQLKFKKELKNLPQVTMAACANRFASELNAEEINELSENAIPGSIKKATGKMRHENISR